jgi:hypothetical protein
VTVGDTAPVLRLVTENYLKRTRAFRNATHEGLEQGYGRLGRVGSAVATAGRLPATQTGGAVKLVLNARTFDKALLLSIHDGALPPVTNLSRLGLGLTSILAISNFVADITVVALESERGALTLRRY